MTLLDAVRERMDLKVKTEAENRAGRSVQALVDQLRKVFPADKLPSDSATVKRCPATASAEIVIDGIKFTSHPSATRCYEWVFSGYYRHLYRFLWWRWVEARACQCFGGEIRHKDVITMLERHNRALMFEQEIKK